MFKRPLEKLARSGIWDISLLLVHNQCKGGLWVSSSPVVASSTLRAYNDVYLSDEIRSCTHPGWFVIAEPDSEWKEKKETNQSIDNQFASVWEKKIPCLLSLLSDFFFQLLQFDADTWTTYFWVLFDRMMLKKNKDWFSICWEIQVYSVALYPRCFATNSSLRHTFD